MLVKVLTLVFFLDSTKEMGALLSYKHSTVPPLTSVLSYA